MQIREIGEFGLIEIIKKYCTGKPDKDLRLAVGDDAAVFKSSAKYTIATTDALVEGIHFDLRHTDFERLGWKALAVNLSDIAAMGGTPRWTLVSLMLTDDIQVENIESFYRGMRKCARRFRTTIIGGNVAKSGQFSVTVTQLGETKRILKRSGACVGDVICVTGNLGGSHAGLKALQNGLSQTKFSKAVLAHTRPIPRLAEISKLDRIKIHACIDISDGLASDLNHVVKASLCGAEISLDKIPIDRETISIAKLFGEKGLDYALNGGEDYELLMTMDEINFRKAKKILRNRLSAIGRITKNKKLRGLDKSGNTMELRPAGFRHF